MIDNYDLFRQHEAEKEEALAKRPKCSECKEHIQDEKAYLINGEWICEKCMEENHKWIEDYE